MVLGMLHRPFYDTLASAPKGIHEPLPSLWADRYIGAARVSLPQTLDDTMRDVVEVERPNRLLQP